MNKVLQQGRYSFLPSVGIRIGACETINKHLVSAYCVLLTMLSTKHI